MSVDRGRSGWRRVRGWVLATCTVWLVIQNLALAALLLVSRPADALAAGLIVARTAFTVGTQLFVIAGAVALGLALAAWLVHGGVEPTAQEEARHD